ncbi:MAG: hypothetical protein OHK0029_04570 [Armatimonadaceae bacterium]
MRLRFPFRLAPIVCGLLATALVGCPASENTSESPTAQVPPVSAERRTLDQPAPPGPRGAQNSPTAEAELPPVGDIKPVALKPVEAVGTLNLEWFSLGGRNARSEADLQKVAEVIRETGAAILGLQEVDDDGVMDRLLRYLPGWKYAIGTSGRQQRCAILWDTNRAAVRRPMEWGDINEGLEASAGNLRAPLVAEARIGKFDFTLIVVHLKAMFDEESIRKRRTQLRRLRARLDEYLADRADKDVVIVGDFNDVADSPAMKELIGSRKGGVGFVVTGAKLPKTVTTYLGKNDRIDHVVVSSPFVSQEEWNGKASVFPKPKTDERQVYEKSVSDHLPTWSTFDTTQDRD